MQLKGTSFFLWRWSGRRTTSAHCPGPRKEPTLLSAPATAKFKSVWWTHLTHCIHSPKNGFLICYYFYSCGMSRTRSVYAACPATPLELVAWAGMTMSFPGRVVPSSHAKNVLYSAFVELECWHSPPSILPVAPGQDISIIMTWGCQTITSSLWAVTHRRCVGWSGPQMGDTWPVEAMTTWCVFGPERGKAAGLPITSQSAVGVNTKEPSRWAASQSV